MSVLSSKIRLGRRPRVHDPRVSDMHRVSLEEFFKLLGWEVIGVSRDGKRGFFVRIRRTKPHLTVVH